MARVKAEIVRSQGIAPETLINDYRRALETCQQLARTAQELRKNTASWRDAGLLAAEVDALKRLQAGSRQGLHPTLGALLPALLDRACKGKL